MHLFGLHFSRCRSRSWNVGTESKGCGLLKVATTQSDDLAHATMSGRTNGRLDVNISVRFIWLSVVLILGHAASGQGNPPAFSIERSVMTKGYDGTKCWVHARVGIVPANDSSKMPTAVLTTQRLKITGSDVFYAINSADSNDLAKTWSPLVEQSGFRRQKIDARTEETVCDFSPMWHAATNKLLGIGQTVRYYDNKVMKVRPRWTAYSVYDSSTMSWSAPKHLKMPDEPEFGSSGAGSVQRFDLPDGDVLLPVYFKDPEKSKYSVTVCRCKFDGSELKYVSHGSEHTIDVKRGLYEPSVTKFGNRFFLTMRNDDHGYVTSGLDGQNFDKARKWRFDDGKELGNYNTQQHWVTHSDALYLVYTRKGAENDHVFRHRAPLFIARVDPDNLAVIRSTECIIVPERGARLGNFGVVNVTPSETWIVVTEWMQTWSHLGRILPVDNQYGADNSIYIAKLKWSKPNKLVER